jgi:hypothetical protein
MKKEVMEQFDSWLDERLGTPVKLEEVMGEVFGVRVKKAAARRKAVRKAGRASKFVRDFYND